MEPGRGLHRSQDQGYLDASDVKSPKLCHLSFPIILTHLLCLFSGSLVETLVL